MEKNVRKVANFVASCNDMLSERFLDFHKAIKNIVDAINESDDILSYLASKIMDEKSEEIFSSAFSIDSKTKNGKISLPSDEKEKLTLFVTVLNDLESKKLNFNKFLETYFNGGQGTPTQMFLTKIIEPFKCLVADYFKVDNNLTYNDLKFLKEEEEPVEEALDEVNFEEEFEEEDVISIATKNILRVTDEIVAKLKFERKKAELVDDFSFMLEALRTACEEKNMTYINALVLGINYVSQKIKSVKYLVNELNEIVYNVYKG